MDVRNCFFLKRYQFFAGIALAVLFVLTEPCHGAEMKQPLVWIRDVPLPGEATRFDYQSVDSRAGRLYLSHMGDGELVVFDLRREKVIGRLKGYPRTTGVLVVPELGRLFASVPGQHKVAVIDTSSLKELARLNSGWFPDGLAYASNVGRIFVSDESIGREAVIDAKAATLVGFISLGLGSGNTQYDSANGRIFVTEGVRGDLAEVDPQAMFVVARHPLRGGSQPHGLLILPKQELAFVACEGDAKLLVVDLKDFAVKQTFDTGDGPDVLAFDAGLGRFYVACESDVISVFQLEGRTLRKVADDPVGPNCHSVSVDPDTHRVYVPLETVDGQPVLRILKPSF